MTPPNVAIGSRPYSAKHYSLISTSGWPLDVRLESCSIGLDDAKKLFDSHKAVVVTLHHLRFSGVVVSFRPHADGTCTLDFHRTSDFDAPRDTRLARISLRKLPSTATR